MDVQRKNAIPRMYDFFPPNALSKAGEPGVSRVTTGNSLVCYFSLFGDLRELKMTENED